MTKLGVGLFIPICLLMLLFLFSALPPVEAKKEKIREDLLGCWHQVKEKNEAFYSICLEPNGVAHTTVFMPKAAEGLGNEARWRSVGRRLELLGWPGTDGWLSESHLVSCGYTMNANENGIEFKDCEIAGRWRKQ